MHDGGAEDAEPSASAPGHAIAAASPAWRAPSVSEGWVALRLRLRLRSFSPHLAFSTLYIEKHLIETLWMAMRFRSVFSHKKVHCLRSDSPWGASSF